MTDHDFEEERRVLAARIATDDGLRAASQDWLIRAQTGKYSYLFDWLGLPIIQYPQDIVAMQELAWTLQPDLVIETGLARGGSAIFYASMLELNAACGGPEDAEVVVVDIDIRPHNRAAIEAHPLSKRVRMIEGSSLDERVVEQIAVKAEGRSRVLVCLDSNHTHDHVLAELRSYAPLVSVGSYCVVFDTLIQDLPPSAIGDRPWGRGNNPLTAVEAYLAEDPRFEVDRGRHEKLQITVARGGYLRRAH